MERGICIIFERREIIQEERQEILRFAPNCAAFKVLLLPTRWYYSQLLKAAKRQAS